MTVKFQDEQGELYRVRVVKSDSKPYYEVVEVHRWIDGLSKWKELPNECAPEDWLEYAQKSDFGKEKMKSSALYYVETLALAKRSRNRLC